MGFGISLFLIAVGAILAFAVTDRINGVDLVMVGWIVIGVGAIGLLASMVWWSSFGLAGTPRRSVVQRQVTPTGDTVVRDDVVR